MVIGLGIIIAVVSVVSAIGGSAGKDRKSLFYAEFGDMKAVCLEAEETRCGMTLTTCSSGLIYHCAQGVVEIPREKMIQQEDESIERSAPEMM